MPGPETEAVSTDLENYIDTSMEGTEDDFLGGDEELDDDSTEGADEVADDVDTGPEPELPLDQPQQQQPQAPDPGNPNGYTRVGNLFADKAGNIVNSQGRVIAAKGEAARHWVNMSKQAGQAQHLQRQRHYRYNRTKSRDMRN